MIGVQGSVPEADGRPVMGRANAPSLLAPGDPYPHAIQSPRPSDPIVGRHYAADQPWPVPKGYQVAGHDYEGPIPEGSGHPPAVHGTEPLVAPVDRWQLNQWTPQMDGAQWGNSFPRAVPAPPPTDAPPPAQGSKHKIPHILFASWHPVGQNLESRVAYGGHVVIRRLTSPTGIPGQTPYYQAPNTFRSGPPPRWDLGVLLNGQ